MNDQIRKNVLFVVAHPDDETLWAGGTILNYTDWTCTILSLTRKSDVQRSENFSKAMDVFHANGIMGDLDDGPDQYPLPIEEVKETIMSLLNERIYHLIITHHPKGEYTRHLRHEETSRAVIQLWEEQKLISDELWLFAYEDGKRAYFPRSIKKNSSVYVLPQSLWEKKYQLICNIYGFKANSWEALTCPKEESFFMIHDRNEILLYKYLNYENPSII